MSPSHVSRVSYLRWIPLGVQFGLAVVIALSTAAAVKIHNEVAAGALIGFLFVQILLSSVWIALAPLNLVTRIISSTFVMLFFSLCMYRVAWRDGSGHAIAASIVVPMLIQWLLFQVPLWSIRIRGWKLVIPGQEIHVDRKEEFQFGIKHLLIWTTVIAVFLAIANAIVSSIDFAQGGGSGVDAIEIGIQLTLGNGLIAVPIIWGCLVKHYLRVWILIAIAVCVFVTAVELWLQGAKTEFEFVIAINISQAVLAILAMLAVRLTGYRLDRVGA